MPSQSYKVSGHNKAHLAQQSRKGAGFTLLELIIIVGIVAILAAVGALILNPIEYLKQARDAQRIQDLQSLRKAIDFADFENKSLGVAQTVYISIPSLQPDCSDLNLPSLPTGSQYSCKTESDLRKVDGSGWIPVDFSSLSTKSPLAVLPVDPVNATSSSLFYTYVMGGSHELTAVLEAKKSADLPDLTAGNLTGSSIRGVYSSRSHKPLTPPFRSNLIRFNNLWVMRFEAKYDRYGDGRGDTAAEAGCSGTGGSGLSWAHPNCGDVTKIVTTYDGVPIVDITHDEARAACAGIKMRLLENEEWMSIARGTEQVAKNWSGGAVGSGCIFRGNSGWDETCGYDGSNPEGGSTRNAKAKLTLENDEEIWDFAGNVWEHVARDSNHNWITDAEQPDAQPVGSFVWREFTDLAGYGALSYDAVRPSNGAWNSTQGTGQIFTCDQCAGSTNRIITRGGAWNLSTQTGPFAMYLFWTPETEFATLGFRCAK